LTVDEYQEVLRKLKMVGITTAIMSDVMSNVAGGTMAENVALQDGSGMREWYSELQKYQWKILESNEEERNILYCEDGTPKEYPSAITYVKESVQETASMIVRRMYLRAIDEDPQDIQNDVFGVNNIDWNNKHVKAHIEKRTRGVPGTDRGQMSLRDEMEMEWMRLENQERDMAGTQPESQSVSQQGEKSASRKGGRRDEEVLATPPAKKPGEKSASRKRQRNEEVLATPPAEKPPKFTSSGRKVTSPKYFS
jgi:hypothetical protein